MIYLGVGSLDNDETTDHDGCVLREPGRQEPAGLAGILRKARVREGHGRGSAELAQPVEEFADVREHQRRLKAKGLTLTSEADESGTGPGSVMLLDPDGNPVLIDQHVASTS
jgi:hypothetical protein